jgi:tryptophan halogenase
MDPPEIRSIVIVGAGSAGLLTALTLKRLLSNIAVRVIHSADLGIIGVGEGTTPFVPQHLLNTLRLDPARLYAEAQPTWKLGLRFLWGPRPHFFYSFDRQFEARWSDLQKSNGFYCECDCPPCDVPAALMAAGKATSAPRRRLAADPFRNGLPPRERKARQIPGCEIGRKPEQF